MKEDQPWNVHKQSRHFTAVAFVQFLDADRQGARMVFEVRGGEFVMWFIPQKHSLVLTKGFFLALKGKTKKSPNILNKDQ